MSVYGYDRIPEIGHIPETVDSSLIKDVYIPSKTIKQIGDWMLVKNWQGEYYAKHKVHGLFHMRDELHFYKFMREMGVLKDED